MADVKFSALPATVTVATSDIFPVVQGGATKKITFANAISALGIVTGSGTIGQFARWSASGVLETFNLLGTANTWAQSQTFGGQLVSTQGANSMVFNSASAANGYQVFNMQNTSGRVQFGLEGAAAGTLMTGDTAYAGVMFTIGAVPLQFGTNQETAISIDGTTQAVTVLKAALNIRGTTSGVASVATINFRDSAGTINSYITHANGGMYIYTASGTNTAITIGTNELDAIGINGSTQHITLPGVPSGRAAVSTGEVFKDTAANITASSDLFLAIKV